MLMFKCVKGLAPDYLCELVINNHNRTLRSSTLNLLPVSRHKLSQVHNSSFKSVGPRLWNMLPDDLRTENDLMTFKSKLKTVLIVDISHPVCTNMSDLRQIRNPLWSSG